MFYIKIYFTAGNSNSDSDSHEVCFRKTRDERDEQSKMQGKEEKRLKVKPSEFLVAQARN